MQWYFKVFRHYFDFRGRASRAEFWWFVAINAIVSFLLSIPLGFAVAVENESLTLFFQMIAALYSLAVFIPRLAVTVRRLHDVGRSGLNYLWMLLPVIGWLLVFYWLVSRSEEARNHWGPDPRIIDYKAQVQL